MDQPKITIYYHPNPEIRSFLITEAISVPRVETFEAPLDNDSENDIKRLGVIGSRIVKDVMILPGVKEIRIKPKEIRMKKKISHSWEDIDEKVIQILKRALTRKEIRILK